MHAVYSYILFFQVEKVYCVSEAVVFCFKMKEKNKQYWYYFQKIGSTPGVDVERMNNLPLSAMKTRPIWLVSDGVEKIILCENFAKMCRL